MAIRARARAEKDRSERWLLTYADLITLLMVFFVVLYSFSIIDVQRFEDLKGSLDKAFNQGILAGLSSTSLNESVAYGTVTQKIVSNDPAAQVAVASQLQKAIDAAGAGDAVTVNEVVQGVTVSLAADVLFQSGTAQLKPGGKQLIGRIIQPLLGMPNAVEIAGNTDDIGPAPTNSQFRDNWQVGQARAYAVLRTMVDDDRFPQDRLSLWSKSQYAPVAPNDSPEDRAQNRRVDLLVVFPQPPDSSQPPTAGSRQAAGAANLTGS